jgi:hypothetical protein
MRASHWSPYPSGHHDDGVFVQTVSEERYVTFDPLALSFRCAR